MGQPFKVSEVSCELKTQYPDDETLAQVATQLSKTEKKGFIRLWMSEGIPYVFTEAPILYENVRNWLSERLKIHHKEITIIGSGRIGYSMSSFPNFGRPFNPASDLDLCAISGTLFKALKEEFYKWKDDYLNNKIKPKNSSMAKYWKENASRVPLNIKRGFIDGNRVPYIKKWYPVAQIIGQSMFLLKEKLYRTDLAPNVSKTTIRIYNNWSAFTKQMLINLNYALHSLKNN